MLVDQKETRKNGLGFRKAKGSKENGLGFVEKQRKARKTV